MGLEEAELRAALRAVALKHPTWEWRKPRWHLRTQLLCAGVALNAIAETGIEPTYVRCDIGPEFTAGSLIDGVPLPGWTGRLSLQNGFIESFNAQFRREQLASETIDTVTEAEYFAQN